YGSQTIYRVLRAGDRNDGLRNQIDNVGWRTRAGKDSDPRGEIEAGNEFSNGRDVRQLRTTFRPVRCDERDLLGRHGAAERRIGGKQCAHVAAKESWNRVSGAPERN